MKMYTLKEYLHIPEDYMWVQRSLGGRWVPCKIVVELVGHEHRIEVQTPANMFVYWSDETETDETKRVRFLGPIEQPDDDIL